MGLNDFDEFLTLIRREEPAESYVWNAIIEQIVQVLSRYRPSSGCSPVRLHGLWDNGGFRMGCRTAHRYVSMAGTWLKSNSHLGHSSASGQHDTRNFRVTST